MRDYGCWIDGEESGIGHKVAWQPPVQGVEVPAWREMLGAKQSS